MIIRTGAPRQHMRGVHGEDSLVVVGVIKLKTLPILAVVALCIGLNEVVASTRVINIDISHIRANMQGHVDQQDRRGQKTLGREHCLKLLTSQG